MPKVYISSNDVWAAAAEVQQAITVNAAVVGPTFLSTRESFGGTYGTGGTIEGTSALVPVGVAVIGHR